MRFWTGLVAMLLCGPAMAGSLIAIVIDDMGNNLSDGQLALTLPGPVTYAFLPGTPHARDLSRQAYQSRKESIVHLPMEAIEDKLLGPVGLTDGMPSEELRRVVNESIESVPNAVGINNHMGSLLTSQRIPMEQLMQILVQRGNFYFLDSRTHHTTIAEQVALEHGVPATRRDFFLDTIDEYHHIEQQFDLFLAHAQRYGAAVAIGHPGKKTLAVLQKELPQLAQKGIELVPVSRLIAQQNKPIRSIVKLEKIKIPEFQ